jgi:hypothetical protein
MKKSEKREFNKRCKELRDKLPVPDLTLDEHNRFWKEYALELLRDLTSKVESGEIQYQGGSSTAPVRSVDVPGYEFPRIEQIGKLIVRMNFKFKTPVVIPPKH